MNMPALRKLHGLLPVLAACLVVAAACPVGGVAEDLRILSGASGLRLQVVGNREEFTDWKVETSGDPAGWTGAVVVGTRVSGGESEAPVLDLGPAVPDAARFFRSVRTAGLYDPGLFRTFHLTFRESNWVNRLTTARSTGVDVECVLDVDNGLRLGGVGARYKGNTSFSMAGVKKSINVTVNLTNDATEVLGYEVFNLNNAFGDETILREPVYFTVMSRYTPSPRAAMARLYVNGADWGVYSLAQNGDSDLVKDWFPGASGDRWRAPNAAGTGGGGGPGGPGGGGGFSSPLSALTYLGPSLASYRPNYELRRSSDTNAAWTRLTNAIAVLHFTPPAADTFFDTVDGVLAVDRWCWFLALENLFTDDDSYWNKGADYAFYFEPESGRIHPLEHDGNEAFVAGDVSLSPLQGSAGTNRPVIQRFLASPEVRQRYLAHLRTALEESFRPDRLMPLVNAFTNLSLAAITADPKKGYAMTAYHSDLASLRAFVTNRYRFLTNHAELRPVGPVISAVTVPGEAPAGLGAGVTARVAGWGDEGVSSVWLYHRGGTAGRFVRTEMLDDGLHGDGAAGDGVYGATTGAFPAGTRVRCYVEARSGNAARTARFHPARPELDALTFRVVPGTGAVSPVVINELMADNTSTLADAQGGFDDWIELRNLSDDEVDLSGKYLSDDPDEPRKWAFPEGTRIPAGGHLLVWADDDAADPVGLHAGFRLGKSGETVLLVDSDANLNVLMDSTTYGPLGPDQAWGRPSGDPAVFRTLVPTPGTANP